MEDSKFCIKKRGYGMCCIKLAITLNEDFKVDWYYGVPSGTYTKYVEKYLLDYAALHSERAVLISIEEFGTGSGPVTESMLEEMCKKFFDVAIKSL